MSALAQVELTEDALAAAWAALPPERLAAHKLATDGDHRTTAARRARPIVLAVGSRAKLRADRIVSSTPPGPLYELCRVGLDLRLEPDRWELR